MIGGMSASETEAARTAAPQSPSAGRHAAPAPEVVEDLLGAPWVARTIPLGDLTDGGEEPDAPDVATLVHHADAGSAPRAVLYLPGFVDYFFQTEHAQAWIDAGYDFYGLDMRRSGRSTNGHPRPDDIRDLRVHDEEIGKALAIIREGGPRPVVLLGHSTGGLQAVLWAADHPGSVDALVLNSPWLDLNAGWFQRVPFTAVVDRLGAWLPSVPVGALNQAYGRYLHTGTGGDWGYDLALKPHEGFPARAGLVRAVRRAQAQIGRGLEVSVPVLVCCSTRSGDRRHPGPADLSTSDVVLDVRQMISRAPMIGEDVTILQVPGGIHDLALSPQPGREYYTRSAVEWAGSRLAVDRGA